MHHHRVTKKNRDVRTFRFLIITKPLSPIINTVKAKFDYSIYCRKLCTIIARISTRNFVGSCFGNNEIIICLLGIMSNLLETAAKILAIQCKIVGFMAKDIKFCKMISIRIHIFYLFIFPISSII